ncbi:MAG: FAD-dependent oxidoreductase [Flavobacterium sp.]|uniref:NAD(P)/FAD-dependent oxidoreductase n=1 Tax=Flavobacterium sp. TaxID=239 RepID=UPI0022BDFFA1|nr:FAD-dependent oxidoreductase [Flavobacterium sp.]MCZ8197965.1 FAD-dependent oxidoreductase [Flavobacterium sp.]
MVDYIIIGCNLAGIAFAENILNANKKILVFDNNSQNSSKVAAGLYNPVVLKRFTATPEAKEQLELLNVFYRNIESKLNSNFLFEMPVLRKFFSVEEQNNWFTASDNPLLSPFLSANLVTDKFDGVDSPFDYGQVLYTGYLDTAIFIDSFREYLKSNSLLIEDSFEYDQLQFEDDLILYKNFKAKHIVFAEGFGMHSNPYFNHLPLDGTKGDLLLIKAPKLCFNVIINASVFILPIGNHYFKVGATYNWQDKTTTPTEEGKQELIEKLKDIINCDFEIIEHFAGIRPTVRDRRPLLGTHSEHKNVHILNGLGTRGVMLAPYLAKALFEYIEYGKELKPEMDIKRFKKKN